MTNIDNNNYCVILAGGKGRRLWPCSRESYPKQFIDFFGDGRTQLQQTFDRMKKIVPTGHIFVNTNQTYVDLVREQLPELPEENIMAEPIYRNTAPSVAWATHRIMHINAEANLLITPSDQVIYDEAKFKESVAEGFDFVSSNDCLLTFGVRPTRPEPGYGYIQRGDAASNNVCRVKSFTEKPEREFAQMFMENGEFLWNTGIFLSNIGYLWQHFGNILPAVLSKLDEMNPHWSISEETDYVEHNFSAFPNMSMDYGVLEKSEASYVMRCDFGWADLGTWHSIYEACSKSDNNNVVIDSDVMLDNCHHNVIKLPKGRLAVINGLDGYIIAEQGNVLLICKKEDSSALVRKYVTEVQLKKGDEYV